MARRSGNRQTYFYPCGFLVCDLAVVPFPTGFLTATCLLMLFSPFLFPQGFGTVFLACIFWILETRSLGGEYCHTCGREGHSDRKPSGMLQERQCLG
jgi:hypothetical protein